MASPQIMIVEDDCLVAYDIQRTIESFGYSVLGVEDSGENALEKANQLKPDLILMDIMLKGKMNGIEAAFRIRENMQVPIVYLTAFGDNDTFNKALQTNPSGYILKPFRRNDLYATLEVALFRCGRETDLHPVGENLAVIPQDPRCTVRENESPAAKNENRVLNKIIEKHAKPLTGLLNDLRAERMSQQSLNSLVRVCYKLALNRARKVIGRLYCINKKWEMSSEDLAIEGIAELFVMNGKRKMLNLKIALLNWSEPMDDDADVLYFLNKMVGLGIHQYMNKLFRNTDPDFARVLDSVIYSLKGSGMKKMDYFDTVCIVREDSARICSPVMGFNDLFDLPINTTLPMREMLAEVMTYIEENTEFFPAIPLNALAERILLYTQNPSHLSGSFITSSFDECCMNDIVEKALHCTLLKLEKTYSRKLSDLEIRSMSSALAEISQDLLSGISAWNLFEYLENHMEGLTREVYRNEYQSIFEYLIKLFKFELLKHIKR